MPRQKGKKVEPIPQDQIKSWNELVRNTREVVQTQDNATYDLILLAGQVTTEYGENRVQRWAEESGISFSQAKQYKWMAKKGFNEDFIAKWCNTPGKKRGLNYSIIREVASYCGSLSSPYAEEKLQWALEHKASVAAIRGYMYELDAPMNEKDEAHASIKMALRDKQDNEGFTDYMRAALERIVEENPEAEEQVLRTVISNENDFQALQVAAGISEDTDGDAERFSRQWIAKLKRMRGQVKDSRTQLISHIETGHITSAEVYDHVKYLRDMLNEVLEAELPSFEHLEEHVAEAS